MRYDGLPPSEYNLPPGCSQRDCEGSGIAEDRDDEDMNPYDAEDEAERTRQAQQRRAGELSAVLLDITRPQPIAWLLDGAIDLTADARRMHEEVGK